jgi:hypothetical protein
MLQYPCRARSIAKNSARSTSRAASLPPADNPQTVATLPPDTPPFRAFGETKNCSGTAPSFPASRSIKSTHQFSSSVPDSDRK